MPLLQSQCLEVKSRSKPRPVPSRAESHTGYTYHA